MKHVIHDLPRKWKRFFLLFFLGVVIKLFCPGYDMTGLAFMGVAALIPGYHLLDLIRERYPRFGKGLRMGAGVNGTVPSRSLRERLDGAYEYLMTYPENIAIVSGGQGSGEDITEAQCMFDYLVARGIHPDRIWMEPEATNTLENLQLSLDVVEAKTGVRPRQVAILSSEYHLHRAGMFAGWLGLDAELVPAKTVVPPLRWNYLLREVFAVWYYLLLGGY